MGDSLLLGMGKDQAKANLSQLDDPWEQPPYFLLRKSRNKWKGMRTYSGYWKEKEEEHTAIRSAGQSSSSFSASPPYVGVRKTLEFYLKDGTRGGEGTKTDWICHEYHHLRKDDDGEALFLQEDVVLRKVFNKCKNKTGQQSSVYSQLESCVKAYKELYPFHRGNHGNKTEVFLRREGLDIHSIAHRRPQYQDIVQNEDLGDLGVLNEDLGDLGVRNEGVGVPIEDLGVQTEDVGVQNEDLVVPIEDLGVQNEVGARSKDLEVQNEGLSLEEDVVLPKVLKKGTNRIHQASPSRCGNQSDSILRTEGSDLPRTQRFDLPNNPRKDEYFLRELRKYVLQAMVATAVTYAKYPPWPKRRPGRTTDWENEVLGVHCGPYGRSDSVWKHFTKICSANDPDEVYAACHRCDKLLKAHPKKHGTSHLKRHIQSCSSCCNPSTDEDREMLHHLRTVLDDPYKQQKIDEKVDCQEDLTKLDPWHPKLTNNPTYVTRSLNLQTQGGHWEEIKKNLTAIRQDHLQMEGCWEDIHKEIGVVQMDHRFQVQVPLYMGLRRTLQFQHQDGTRMDWIMLEYQQLDNIESPALLLQGAMVIRKVFRYDKHGVASAFSEMDRWLNADDGDAEYFSGVGVDTDDTTTPSSDYMDTPIDKKRKRTGSSSGRKSEVWMHFTKIYNTDYGLVHVVCHTCDRGLTSGRSTNGTSHLKRHTKSCASKHPRTGNANDATTEWETEICPLFLHLKNYGEH